MNQSQQIIEALREVFRTKYHEIGHFGEGPNFMWIWYKGKVLSKEMGSGAGYDHNRAFPGMIPIWSGRFDSKLNKVSVLHVPTSSKAAVDLVNPNPPRLPLDVKKALKDEYGDRVVFVGFFGVRT